MRKCLLCKGSDTRYFITINNYCLYKCNGCGVVYTEQKSKDDRHVFNKSFYSRAYLDKYEDRASYLEQRFIERTKEIEMYKKGNIILDFGCSTGIFLRAFQKHAKYRWSLYGLDINKESIHALKKHIRGHFYCNELDKVKFQSNLFDCIVCFDVLEHIQQIEFVLSELNRVLKNGGILMIQMPNYMSLMAILCGNNWDWWSTPDHIYHFNMRTMETVLINSRFKILSKKTWEPKNEFISNIQGTIYKKLTTFISINKIGAKLSYLILLPLYYIVKILENWIPVGGLLLITVTKDKFDS